MTENKETVEQQLLDKACRKATSDGIQQVMLALQDGKLVLSGAQNYVPPLVDDSDLFRKVENLMNQATLDENDDLFHATNKIPKYALLPCSPSPLHSRVERIGQPKVDFEGNAGCSWL